MDGDSVYYNRMNVNCSYTYAGRHTSCHPPLLAAFRTGFPNLWPVPGSRWVLENNGSGPLIYEPNIRADVLACATLINQVTHTSGSGGLLRTILTKEKPADFIPHRRVYNFSAASPCPLLIFHICLTRNTSSGGNLQKNPNTNVPPRLGLLLSCRSRLIDCHTMNTEDYGYHIHNLGSLRPTIASFYHDSVPR